MPARTDLAADVALRKFGAWALQFGALNRSLFGPSIWKLKRHEKATSPPPEDAPTEPFDQEKDSENPETEPLVPSVIGCKGGGVGGGGGGQIWQCECKHDAFLCEAQ